MDLLSVTATNACSFERLEMPLHRQGLVWIGGHNCDSEAAKSNGSGKSNVFKVITWALYGETIDDEDPDKIIRLGTKCASAKVEATDGETSWRWERDRRKGAPRLRLYRDGALQDGSRTELQARINELLGIDFQAFRNTSMYAQRDNKRFAEPEVTDAQRKEVLQRILRTNIYGVCHAWTKEQNLDLKRSESSLSATLATYRARVDEIDLDGLEAETSAWDDERRDRVVAARESARAFLTEAKTLRASAPDLDDIETRLASLRSERAERSKSASGIDAIEASITTLQERVNDIDVEVRTAEREAQSIDERLAALEGESTCPTCSSSLAEGSTAHEHVVQMRADFETKTDEWHDASKRLSVARASLADEFKRRDAARRASREVRRHDDLIANALDELNEGRDHGRRVDVVAASARAKLDEAKSIAAETNPHTSRLETARARVDELNALIETTQAELDAVTNRRAHFEFWMRGFGPTGLPSFALDKWMPYLTERANHYLEVLADGDITMTFSTQRELKAKGEYRDEIGINWSIEGVDGYPPSGGQFKKMSVATDFALMDLACSREGAFIDLLCLDECLDGLDAEGRQRVLHLLHSLRSRRGSIFVVSHEQDVAEVFERAITVVKKDGVSTLEVA